MGLLHYYTTSNFAKVDKIGVTEAGLGAGDSLNPKVWRGVKLKEFAIYHGEPPCAAGETMFPAYHHGDYPGQTENLELRSNGSLVVSWDDRSVELQTSNGEHQNCSTKLSLILIIFKSFK